MEIEILDARNSKPITKLTVLEPDATIEDLKREFSKSKHGYAINRQTFKLEPNGKTISNGTTLQSLNITNGSQLYFRDLGPQIGWKTVFFLEYSMPIVIYLWLYQRPYLIYGEENASRPRNLTVHVSAFCWCLHYIKRLLETEFVHRFSHETMPLLNLFKNCSYYWLFAGYIGYTLNYPFYHTPSFGNYCLVIGFVVFIICEIGNLSIHVIFKNLRPKGTKERKMPEPSSNVFTLLFNWVSCPNYTYEIGCWVGFTVMTFSLPVGLFTLIGGGQMTIWALDKHRNYQIEFPDYPKNRKAIFPFIL